MKIIFVSMRSPLTYLGGAEILTLLVAEGLAMKGHDVAIYTAGKSKTTSVDDVKIIYTPLLMFPQRFRTVLMPIYSFVLKRIFKNIVDFMNADIIHAIDSDSIVLMSRWDFLKNKFVVTIQDYNLVMPQNDYWAESYQQYHWFTPYISGLTRYVRSRVAFHALQNIRHAVCVSRYVADKLFIMNKNVQISVVSNCVPRKWLRSGVNSKKDIDILYVGKLVKYKGLDVLLNSMSQIVRKIHCHLYVIGDGFRATYEDRVMELGLQKYVTFVGTISHEHIRKYYLRSKIVVSPSLWPEPCGRTIIEGMACGCPIVATNIGGTPESFVDKQHGYLINPNNSRAITKACLYLLIHDAVRFRLGSAAFLFAKRAYSESKIAQSYEDIYTLIKSNRVL